MSGGFERACVLFNIAALQSQIGEAQNRQADESLQKAAKYFKVSQFSLPHLSIALRSI